MKLSSTAFADSTAIPKKFTADGADVSPALQWSDVPAGTHSLTLICDDPDAPRGTWVHWVLFNLPADLRELPEDLAANVGVQGNNDFGNLGYGGPSPPRGKPHRYFFKLYALDIVLDILKGSTKVQVEKAMSGHILGSAQVIGTFGR